MARVDAEDLLFCTFFAKVGEKCYICIVHSIYYAGI